MDFNSDVNYQEYFEIALKTYDTVEGGTFFLSQIGPILAGIFVTLVLIFLVIFVCALIYWLFKKFPNALTK